MNDKSMMREGTVLRGIYRIEKQLASGGFGNTYMAANIEFGEHVAIKEFFMKGINDRDETTSSVSVSNISNYESFVQQREKFKKEARRLRKLSNPHIVAVHDLFEENSTVYYVMDYIDGENLAERMRRTGEPLTEEEVWKLLPQVLDALKTVHDTGIWHLDLKPGNIMVDKAGNATLIDFGASKQMDAQTGGATAKTAVSFTNGYAPREQMEKNYSKMGPWTDIYSLGATLYALLTNKRPPLPSDIDDDESPDKNVALPFPDGTSDKMRSLILWMMNTHRNKRPQSIDTLLNYLDLKRPEEEGSQDTEPAGIIQEEKKVDEETCLNDGSNTESHETDNEETVFSKTTDDAVEAPSFETYQEEPQSQSQSQPQYQEKADEGGNKAWIVGLVVTVAVMLAVVFGFKKCSKTETAKDPAATTDTINTKNLESGHHTKIAIHCTIGNLGDCSYSGELDDAGRPHGEGEAKFNDGRYYKGAFNHGQLTGKVKGLFKYQNGGRV